MLLAMALAAKDYRSLYNLCTRPLRARLRETLDPYEPDNDLCLRTSRVLPSVILPAAQLSWIRNKAT